MWLYTEKSVLWHLFYLPKVSVSMISIAFLCGISVLQIHSGQWVIISSLPFALWFPCVMGRQCLKCIALMVHFITLQQNFSPTSWILNSYVLSNRFKISTISNIVLHDTGDADELISSLKGHVSWQLLHTDWRWSFFTPLIEMNISTAVSYWVWKKWKWD